VCRPSALNMASSFVSLCSGLPCATSSAFIARNVLPTQLSHLRGAGNVQGHGGATEGDDQACAEGGGEEE
jgi:hypothetical protein